MKHTINEQIFQNKIKNIFYQIKSNDKRIYKKHKNILMIIIKYHQRMIKTKKYKYQVTG